MTYLLTCHGTVLCRERAGGALLHRPIAASYDDADPLSIGEAGNALHATYVGFLRDDIADLGFTFPDGPLAGWLAQRSADQRSLTLSRDGQHLTAHPDSQTIRSNPGQPEEWASFLPISKADFAAVLDIRQGLWLHRSAGPTPEAATIGSGFCLRIGSLEADLRWNLPFDLSAFPHRLTLLRDAWRIDRIERYRPLVYFAAFGDVTIMRQFALSLRSLVTAGEYTGDIAVLTDKTVEEMRAFMPPDLPNNLVVLHLPLKDRVGYMAARYAIRTWRHAWDFQPLLYVDTDILFDLPLAPMLHAIARSDRIAAPVEPTEPLATSVFVGAPLLQQDGCQPGAMLGFNSGTFGIPNLRQHAGTFDLIGRIMANRAAIHARTSMPYLDQEIANYVSYRVAGFDTELFGAYVRLASAAAEPSGRKGLVHFCWVPGAERRVEVMQRYLEQLGERNPRGDAMSDPDTASRA